MHDLTDYLLLKRISFDDEPVVHQDNHNRLSGWP
jgi:hypothetical protein